MFRKPLIAFLILLSLSANAQKKTVLKNSPLQKGTNDLEYIFKYLASSNVKAPIISLIMQRTACGVADAEMKVETVGSNLSSRYAVFHALYDFTQGDNNYLYQNLRNIGLNAVDSKVLADYIINSNTKTTPDNAPVESSSNDSKSIVYDKPYLKLSDMFEFVKRNTFSVTDIKSYLSSVLMPTSGVDFLDVSVVVTWPNNTDETLEYFPKTHTLNVEIEDATLYKALLRELSNGKFKKLSHRPTYTELSNVVYFNETYSILCISAQGGSMGNTLYSLKITRSKPVKG